MKVQLVELLLPDVLFAPNPGLVCVHQGHEACVNYDDQRPGNKEHPEDVFDLLCCEIRVDIVSYQERQGHVVVEHTQELPYIVEILQPAGWLVVRSL